MNLVVENIGSLLTLEGVHKKKGRKVTLQDLSVIYDAAMVIEGASDDAVAVPEGSPVPIATGGGPSAKIAWIGKQSALPEKYSSYEKVNAEKRMVLPGLVDSHTHLVFAGDRSTEFGMRMSGKTYQEIAKAGGGIVRTVEATRKISYENLLRISQQRVANFLKQGVTTIEIKSGYGLDFDSELKSLKVIDELKRTSGATIRSTFLAAHAIPTEYKGRKADYVNLIAYDWLPRVKKYCDYVDMFLDEGFFNEDDAEIFLTEATKLQMPIRLHADELELSNGTKTAVKYKALSADHLLKIGSWEIQALAKTDVTATLLPTTAFFLKDDYAPARKLLDAGARVALATDFNPGTSPTQDVSIVGLLAALHMEMRVEEIIAALTYNGACALGLQKSKGALIEGFDADFFMIEADSPAQLIYSFGRPTPEMRVFSRGQFVR